MNPTVTKFVAALVSAGLGLAAYIGVPGVDDPQVAVLAEKIAGSVSMLLTGWLFMRQHWLLGEASKTQPVERFEVKSDAKKVVRGKFE